MQKVEKRGVNQRSAAQLESEAAGARVLRDWCEAEFGRASRLAEATGFAPVMISKLKNGRLPIHLYHALAIERATHYVLTVDKLCSYGAQLLDHRPIDPAAQAIARVKAAEKVYPAATHGRPPVVLQSWGG